MNVFFNSFPILSKKLLLRKFPVRIGAAEKVASRQNSPISPGRFLSDIFWESLDYKKLNSALGDQLRVIEIGCGSGKYGDLISKFSCISSYTGVDIQSNRNWSDFDPNQFNFVEDTYEKFEYIVDNQNLIITQSALEHFEKDLRLFKKIDDYASTSQFPVASIHVVPSASSLFTFLWHGIRQYGKFHLRRLHLSSPNCSEFLIFTLGGLPLNWFHFKHVTIPQIFLRIPLISQDKSAYFAELLEAINRDIRKSSSRFSVFTAIVIFWNTGLSHESLVD